MGDALPGSAGVRMANEHGMGTGSRFLACCTRLACLSGAGENRLSMAPEAQLYLEDFVPGSVHEFGPTVVDEAEIIDFARRYDPQPIHTDPEWARTGPFGG